MNVPLAAFERVIVRLRGLGFEVGGYSGWRERSHSGRDLVPVAIIEHHTGGGTTPDSLLAVTGNGTVVGPLCNFTVYLDGTIQVIAAGYANHAGYNDPLAFSELRDLAPMASDIKPGADSASFSGNSRSVGIEVKTSGAFTAAQNRATAALEAALVIELGLSRTRPPVGGHREVTRRKIDPVHPMWKRRCEVRDLIAAWETPAAPVVTPEPVPVPTPTPVPAESLAAILARIAADVTKAQALL